MKAVERFCVLLMCFSIVVSVGPRVHGEAKSGTTRIVSPAAKSAVARVHDVVVETTGKGYPVVWVGAAGKEVEWWTQPTTKSSAAGRFTIRCHFGNDKTPNGTVFHVVSMLAPTQADAELLIKKQVFTRLPAGLPFSKPIQVVRGEKKDAKEVKEVTEVKETPNASDVSQILALRNRSEVTRRQTITGKTSASTDPIILVRSAEKNSLWWVQERAKRKEQGEFSVLVRFGNDRTPVGSQFLVVVVTPKSADDAGQLKVGQSLKELPDGMEKSPEIAVVLGKKAAARPSKTSGG
jgi:hypothetical protein